MNATTWASLLEARNPPWGNRWQVVDYRDVQFTKAPEVLRGMGLDGLEKSEQALTELRAKGLAP